MVTNTGQFFLPCSFPTNTAKRVQTEDHKQPKCSGDKQHFLCRNLKKDKLKNTSNENTYTPEKEGNMQQTLSFLYL